VRRPAPAVLPAIVHRSGSDGSTAADQTVLQIQKQQDDDVRLTLYAPGATTLEISGDFTDWRPVALSRRPGKADIWGATFRMSSGVHRINVRRDGGPWMAPAGTTRSTDDYDGEVGVFILP
jgi:1,4-alpha-glucan branching enzyme